MSDPSSCRCTPCNPPPSVYLSVSVCAHRHADFRELVRDLFSLFNTRIWMQKINPAQVAALQLDGIHVQQLQHQPRAREPAQRPPGRSALPPDPLSSYLNPARPPCKQSSFRGREHTPSSTRPALDPYSLSPSSHHTWSVVGDRLVYHEDPYGLGRDRIDPRDCEQRYQPKPPPRPDLTDHRDVFEYEERYRGAPIRDVYPGPAYRRDYDYTDRLR